MLDKTALKKFFNDEPLRLGALERYQATDTAPDVRFDVIARTASVLLQTQYAFVSFVDEHQTRFKSTVGFDVREIPRSISFCQYAICQDDITVISNAAKDPRFHDNPLVEGPLSVRFYAAAPIIAPDGSRLGAIGVFDNKPRRSVSVTERAALSNLADLVMDQLQLRRKENIGPSLADVSESLQHPLLAVGPSGLIEFSNFSAARLLGYQTDELLNLPMDRLLSTGALRIDTETLISVYRHAKPGHSGGRLARMARHKDGYDIAVEVAVAPWCGPKGPGIAISLFDPSAPPEQEHIADIPGSRAFEATNRTQESLTRALDNHQFVLHYQPQVLLANRRIVGAEALVRWQHPVRGLLTPQYFLRDVEDGGLELPLGWWILDQAMQQAARWNADCFGRPRIGINLFSAQYRSPELVARVTNGLQKYQLSADTIELEITETITLLKDETGFNSLRTLRNMGVRIAFDDFGTGYASLSSLQNFPLTTLKLDRSFVRDILSSKSDAVITRSMISLARELGLESVAEGIETPDQHSMLEALGCDAGQGYFYGRPVTAAELETLMRNRPSH